MFSTCGREKILQTVLDGLHNMTSVPCFRMGTFSAVPCGVPCGIVAFYHPTVPPFHRSTVPWFQLLGSPIARADIRRNGRFGLLEAVKEGEIETKIFSLQVR